MAVHKNTQNHHCDIRKVEEIMEEEVQIPIFIEIWTGNHSLARWIGCKLLAPTEHKTYCRPEINTQNLRGGSGSMRGTS